MQKFHPQEKAQRLGSILIILAVENTFQNSFQSTISITIALMIIQIIIKKIMKISIVYHIPLCS